CSMRGKPRIYGKPHSPDRTWQDIQSAAGLSPRMAGMPDTLATPASHLLEVKHSRFLAHAAPVGNAADALAFVASVLVADATHNCWAYRHGSEYRSSDDGEPAGTAGRPILAAIDGQGYDRIVVVVTRWFGGIKL